MSEEKIEKYKPVSEAELTELIGKILCKQFGFCPVEPETDKIPDKCIPTLKIGENYIQWSPEQNAYRVWANDGSYIGVVKNKSDTCKNAEEWSDGEYW